MRKRKYHHTNSSSINCDIPLLLAPRERAMMIDILPFNFFTDTSTIPLLDSIAITRNDYCIDVACYEEFCGIMECVARFAAIASYMADNSFRTLTTKEILAPHATDEVVDSGMVVMQRHSDSRHRADKHYDRGREIDSATRERSFGFVHSRERSRDQYSNKEESRSDYRDHYHKESDSKQYRSNKLSYERNRSIGRNRSSRHYNPEDGEDESSDRPVWATKAVVKRAEEIQKRKLIWNKPEEKKELENDTVPSLISMRPSTTSTWNSILAASSSDSKQLDKFKRLMGMKKTDEEGQEETSHMDDNQVEAERKRQRELYSHLDHQYAVARSFTHLSRGQGLGFHQ
ncbi:hypothetical protein DINM_002593 [Dirofilaria immitis]|nr:hypothetical protein [Dirofilaria immitis]